MIDKINTYGIVRDHVHTLKNYNTNKYSLVDFILFFVVPFIISGSLIYFNFKLTDSFINVLITSLSIFAALLFNLLLLIYDIIRKKDASVNNKKLKTEFLEQIYANISFCIFIAIIAIIFLIISSLTVTNSETISLNAAKLRTVLALFIYSLLFMFILTLFMILKRVHILLSKEFQI